MKVCAKLEFVIINKIKIMLDGLCIVKNFLLSKYEDVGITALAVESKGTRNAIFLVVEYSLGNVASAQ